MDFTQPWDYGDVTFIIEQRKVYANRATLAMSSEVLRAMFTSHLTEIQLTDKKVDDFLQLMQILHPPNSKFIDENNVERLLPLANEYQIHHVVKRCEKYLLTQPASIHNLILADKFSLSQLRKLCIDSMKDVPYSKLQEEQEFERLNKDILFEIVQCKCHEGNDPSKVLTYKLMSEPPSIETLLLAEEHNMPEIYVKCLKYLRDKPVSKLKAESGYASLRPGTLIEILSHKGEQLETLKAEVSIIANWLIVEEQEQYTGKGENHVNSRCAHSDSPDCTRCKCKSGQNHYKGSDRQCIECARYRLDTICEVLERY